MQGVAQLSVMHEGIFDKLADCAIGPLPFWLAASLRPGWAMCIVEFIYKGWHNKIVVGLYVGVVAHCFFKFKNCFGT